MKLFRNRCIFINGWYHNRFCSVTTALDGINKAYEEQNTDVTSLVDTLGKYTSEQLEGIDFNDGKWDTELGDAEKAVESLCEKLGLTKDQCSFCY